jgi:hypothetical protein
MRLALDPANAAFDAAAGTITFSTVIPASLSHVLRVVNMTREVVYFNPTAEDGIGYVGTATYVSPVLTLAGVDTRTHQNTDLLFIEYDDGSSGGGGGGGGGTGDATAANQVLQTTQLTQINGKLPAIVKTPTTTSVASATASTAILAANANRRGVSVMNDSTATLSLSFSATATAANCFIKLSPGSFILLDQQLIVSNAITGFWSSANGTAQVTEYV